MCGIAGYFSSNGPAQHALLREMGEALAHRGPDDTGVFTSDAVGLAHTRLSIIDLAGGHQPLFALDGDLALVANGEIYNYIELRQELEERGCRFSTHSDCEVILHAYAEFGERFLDRLCGMFAFALYDRAQRCLVLARDRLGIKPLFMASCPLGLVFGSELKAFLPCFPGGMKIDEVGLVQFLQNQFNTGPTTIFRGVERILPGEVIRIGPDLRVQRRRYWSSRAIEPRGVDLAAAGEQFDELMETVVRQHMRSDVPYGLFLSGGIDSSILLALLTRYNDRPIRTFSLGFSDASIESELPAALEIARRFASEHTVLSPDRKQMFYRLPFCVWAADDLIRDHAILPTALLAEETSRVLKVVFTGEGGDEVFAGYGRYRRAFPLRWFGRLLAPGSGGFRTRGTFRGSWPRKLFRPELLSRVADARQPFVRGWREAPSSWSDLQRMQHTDIVTALADDLLVKVDRILMGWGVEGRVPYLDHRIVEFGLSLPDRLKVRGREGKVFLKRWAAGLLPAEHLARRKKGFHVPIAEWLRGDILLRLQEVLPRHVAVQSCFQAAGVRDLIDRQAARGDVGELVWALLQFAVWFRIFIENRGRRPANFEDPVEFIA
ncbi:MAG TPA: asparagine synthase (glutamine-hydrolyzing) [Burkholderiales bacterium]